MGTDQLRPEPGDRSRPAPPRVAKWLADHPKHVRADEARGQLLTAYLTLSTQAAPPRPDSPLGEADLAALAVADEIIKQSPRSEDQAAVAQRVSQHLATRYTARQANAAAADGLRKLLASPLPRASRVAVRLELFQQLKAIAVKHLQDEADSGRLFSADPATLPKDLAEAVAALDTVRQEDPGSAPWTITAQLAVEVRGIQHRAALARSGHGPAGAGRLGGGHCPAGSQGRCRPRGGQDRGQP